MSKQRNTFGMIRYWFRVGMFGLSDKQRKYQNTLWWQRIRNADTSKASKELEKAF